MEYKARCHCGRVRFSFRSSGDSKHGVPEFWRSNAIRLLYCNGIKRY